MTAIEGQIFGTVGALAAFPQRIAARAVEECGGRLARGVSRRTSAVVFGRNLLSRDSDREIEARVSLERNAGRRLLSENGFLRLLGLAPSPDRPALGRQSLIDQSGLGGETLDLLCLFDCFEHDTEPFSFRDLILARKYASLIPDGTAWGTIARSVHRSGAVTALTSKSLHAGRSSAIYVRSEQGLSELNGQLLFDLGSAEDTMLEQIFADAEAAEQGGQLEVAAALYQRCLAIDTRDGVAAFNRANCLRGLGREIEAAHDYARALKLDASFVEAWFNLAGLMTERGRLDSARRHLKKAIAVDGAYADAIFNLAKLEFDAGDLAEARRWWGRYLELDSASEWARTAARGMHFVDLQFAHQSAG